MPESIDPKGCNVTVNLPGVDCVKGAVSIQLIFETNGAACMVLTAEPNKAHNRGLTLRVSEVDELIAALQDAREKLGSMAFKLGTEKVSGTNGTVGN